jgi:HAD superfamily hydrolase (TIGR01509 family)
MKAIIFDMDGLLIDSERLYLDAQEEIAGKFNKTFTNETTWKMMGRRPIEGITIFVEELGIPAAPEEILAMRNELMLQKLKHDLAPMPGLHHIIDTFYGKLQLAIATGAQKEFLDIAVDTLGIREKFAVLQDSDEIKQGKPHPEIYLTTCEKLDLQPGNCVVLEDSANGATAGKRAGCFVIAVPSQHTKEQDFSMADMIAPDLFAAARHIAALCL